MKVLLQILNQMVHYRAAKLTSQQDARGSSAPH